MSLKAQNCVHSLLLDWDLSYAHSLRFDPGSSRKINVTFSKPTREHPAPLVVVHGKFTLDPDLNRVLSLRIENDPHTYALTDKIDQKEYVLDERILDRVVSRKLKMKEELLPLKKIDLQDDYTKSRISPATVVAEGKEEEHEEGKIQEKDNQAKEEEAEESESIRELEKYLIEIFRKADKSKSGTLNYLEFRKVLMDANLNISREDVDVLFAHADENYDGFIEYHEFVEVAVEIVQSMKDANVKSTTSLEDKKNFFENQKFESVQTVSILRQTLLAADYSPPHLTVERLEPAIPRKIFHGCISAPIARLSKEEINMMIALAPTNSEGMVLYSNFEELLYEARYRIYNGQQVGLLMDLENYLLSNFEAAERSERKKDKKFQPTGKLKRHTIVEMLRSLKKLMLSNFHVYSIISMVTEDKNGFIAYRDFIPIAADRIRNIFNREKVNQRAAILRRSKIQPPELIFGKDRDSINKSLLEEFAKYDEDQNGVLDREEFRDCLKGSLLQLSNEDIQTLLSIGDKNGDGVIDYEEFLQIAYSHLLQMARERTLEELLTKHS